MKTTFYELIEEHGKLDDTYVDLIKNADGSVTFIVQTDAEKPVNGVYYYKITGKAQFNKWEWYEKYDGIPYCQVWDIKCAGNNIFKIFFDIGNVEMFLEEIDVVSLTKEEYLELQNSIG